ncbi:LAGLIDADG family homing endonuclease [Alkalibacillus sp. S2W]|uniref:LAGLIDADG family homing endonuclease n=1 Tax=Alkalibacillus sp. S2W TaxID=3386553 RepID=UPI00398D2BDF
MAETTCKWCGKFMKVKKSGYVYCSKRCESFDNGTRKIVYCDWCQKPIEKNTANINKTNFCSRHHLGFANAVRNGAYIEQFQHETEHIDWTEDIAYLVGLIATDGTLRKNRKQIKITSSDEEFLKTVIEVIQNKITGRKQHYQKYLSDKRNINLGQEYVHYEYAFTSPYFYDFCQNAGLTPDKTNTISMLNVPQKYFLDFLRGVIDGDGNFNVIKNEVTRIRIYGGSKLFLEWINNFLKEFYNIKKGWFTHSENDFGSKYHLVFSTYHDVLKIVDLMYHSDKVVCYQKKKERVQDYLDNMTELKMKYNVD